ncbi:hypothetical protein Barb6_00064 [Bacteroidales bacterium Barb6]|nr:hypothetical protein Barb6_00064 [Bacteroidales bacterium Barb6]
MVCYGADAAQIALKGQEISAPHGAQRNVGLRTNTIKSSERTI